MTNVPSGFNTGDLPDDLASQIPLFAEIQKVLAAEGPVNWDLARQVATATAARRGPDPAGGAADEQVVEALRLADLWLDERTALPSGVTTAEAWSRARWIEVTLPAWASLCDPVAERVGAAMVDGLPEEVRAQGAPMLEVMGRVAGLLFGVQVGQALGGLAGEVVGTADVGVPLAPAGHAALLPAGVAAFGAGLGVPAAEVRLYLALREAAHHRLFGHVPWLRAHVVGAVEAYARGIAVDEEVVRRTLDSLDPANPESIRDALGGGVLFDRSPTPEQRAALARLETALALVEGWVADVVDSAAVPRLPAAAALGETLRRRRAAGGPAEQTFATLVGLELRPRRLRDAAALWRALREVRDTAGRDAVWGHPDLLPTASDLDDPAGFVGG